MDTFSKSILTVNGQFPGAKIVASEGDYVVVKVVSQFRRMSPFIGMFPYHLHA